MKILLLIKIIELKNKEISNYKINSYILISEERLKKSDITKHNEYYRELVDDNLIQYGINCKTLRELRSYFDMCIQQAETAIKRIPMRKRFLNKINNLISIEDK